MRYSENMFVLAGNLVSDPIVKEKVAYFTIATGKDKYLQFIPITTFDDFDALRNAKKGDNILAYGRITNNSRILPNGKKEYALQLIASRIQILPNKKQSANIPISDDVDEIEF